ncbi:MAG: hypothetical protein ABJ327_03075 [Litoreibacter sp.]
MNDPQGNSKSGGGTLINVPGEAIDKGRVECLLPVCQGDLAPLKFLPRS